MNRLALWTTVMLLGLLVAVVDLVTGWTLRIGLAGVVITLGLLGGSAALFAAMVIAVIRDRRWIVAHSSDARWVLARASRGVRWGSLFAIGLCLLLFTDCTGSISSSSTAQVSSASQDPTRFLMLAAGVLAPLLLALLLPALLASAAELLVTRRPRAAHRLGRIAMLSIGAVVLVPVVTVAIGFFVGIAACDLGTSAGYCAAGAGSVMNLLSIGAPALFLPYLGLVTWALGSLESGRAQGNC